jgi:hypothetical protein
VNGWNRGALLVDMPTGRFTGLLLVPRFGFSQLRQPSRPSGAVLDLVPNAHVTHSKPHEVATSELAIDGQIEECKVAFAPLKLEPDANCPDFLRLKWAFFAP